MTPRLFVRKVATADVAEAFDWYGSHRTGLGADFADEITAVIAVLHGHRTPHVLQQRR